MSTRVLLIIVSVCAGIGAAVMGRDMKLPEVAAASVVLFAVPSYLALIRTIGRQKGLLTLSVLGMFAIAIETVALATGYPYGEFAYAEGLGASLPGGVPWTVAFAWPPLLIGSYAAAAFITEKTHFRIPLAVAILVAADLVLDPGAVGMGYWAYADGGFWYQVPLSNFMGWIISGVAGALLFRVTAGTISPSREMIDSSLYIVAFWTGISGAFGFWWPAGIGILLILYLYRTGLVRG